MIYKGIHILFDTRKTWYKMDFIICSSLFTYKHLNIYYITTSFCINKTNLQTIFEYIFKWYHLKINFNLLLVDIWIGTSLRQISHGDPFSYSAIPYTIFSIQRLQVIHLAWDKKHSKVTTNMLSGHGITILDIEIDESSLSWIHSSTRVSRILIGTAPFTNITEWNFFISNLEPAMYMFV